MQGGVQQTVGTVLLSESDPCVDGRARYCVGDVLRVGDLEVLGLMVLFVVHHAITINGEEFSADYVKHDV